MTVQQDFPTLNGIAPSWADLKVTNTIYGGQAVKITDFKSIDWGDSVDIGEQRGASGGRVMRRTTGAKKLDDVKATMYRTGLLNWERALMANAPRRGKQVLISLAAGDFEIQYSLPDDSEIYVSRIKGIRLKGRQYKSAEGPDAATVDVMLNPIEVCDVIDGLEVVLI